MAKVVMYKTTTCPFCKMESEYLTSKGITFEEVYVDQKPGEAERLIEESGQMGVPFTEITDDKGNVVKILGFDKGKINEALGISG